MRSTVLVALLLCLSTGACVAQQPMKLTDENKKLLDEVLRDTVIDPTGCTWVSFKAKLHGTWGDAEETTLYAWLKKDEKAKTARLLDIDGDGGDAPATTTTEDFKDYCEGLLKSKEDDKDEPWGRMRQTAQPLGSAPPPLVLAAWLYKLKHEDLAARTLKNAQGGRNDETPLEATRRWLAWRHFAGAVHAFIQRADDEALRRCTIFCEKYGVWDTEFGTSMKELKADLVRRSKSGTFGKAAPEAPKDVASWPDEKKTQWLIEQLEQVDARQWGQPGGVDLGDDWRVEALMDVGEAAVPALIDCIEKDSRFTRAMHFWRDFAQSRTVLGVREAALVAVMSILQVSVFEPVATGDNFTGRGQKTAEETAKKLRAYWEKYGKVPYDERMMKILTDAASTLEAMQEAAINLATLGERRTRGTTVWSGGVREGDKDAKKKAIEKFSEPTIAQAILAAMDRHLKAYDEDPENRNSLYEYSRRRIESTYISCLVELGDTRIAAELKSRCEAEKLVRLRRQWAFACLKLGEDKPFKAYCADLAAGKIELPANDQKNCNDDDQPGNVELTAIARQLLAADTKEARDALLAIADPKHKYHKMLVDRILNDRGWDGDSPWGELKEVAVKALRPSLDDTTETGTTYTIEGDNLKESTGSGWSSGPIPEFLKDAAKRKNNAVCRVCDQAAMKLASFGLGLPEYHPLLKDADERIKKMKETLDKK